MIEKPNCKKRFDIASLLREFARMAIPIKAIQDRRAQIAKERAALDEEERELVIAERVFLRLNGNSEDTSGIPRGQAAIVLDVMGKGKMWWGYDDVRDTARVIHGVEIKLSSLLPIMSRLKKAGTIVRGPEGYALAERLKNEASPTEIREAAI